MIKDDDRLKAVKKTPIPSVESWVVPPECQGQIVEYAYGTDEDGRPWRRVIDRSDGRTIYDLGSWTDESVWQPWNREPQGIDWEIA